MNTDIDIARKNFWQLLINKDMMMMMIAVSESREPVNEKDRGF